MLSIIYACDENNTIGLDGDMPWHLPNDLAYFKRVTGGHHVIMGRKTFDSIGKPLPNRKNTIITRQQWDRDEDVSVVHDITEIKQYEKISEEVFIIGGGQIYAYALPFVQKIYQTKIHASFEGDTTFPLVNEEEWEVVFQEFHQSDEKNKYDHTFYVYERMKKE
ncbi:dihydrofolate reductase [Mangrovibacillus cuniculi]|uniref:Dihydrofolate reductase n=1 Tax=Mangrovibacillus cuniculi TaxID=2593652 RepID=A0A7S8CAW2_9BACI|nr:dihydrofolate reductase [Mangrovibacillus cuniculi]QPC46621.1 dihydrofolate reductase [Mangrovibacillus cuniculi]